jgi:hypothetical protein
MYNLLVALGAVAAVVMITWGGFEYMTSDAVQGKSDGLKKVQNAIYGLLLILSSYLILRTIDPRFVVIPSSLVDPLGLSAKNNTSLDWLTRLASEVRQFDADQAAARDKIAEANVKIAGLAKNLDESAKKIANLSGIDTESVNVESLDINAMCKDPSTAEIAAECANRLGLQNEIVKTQSETTLFTRQKIIDTLVAQCGTTAAKYDATCYTRQINQIESNYAKNSSGMNPEDTAALQNYALSARAKVAMNSWFDTYDVAAKNYATDTYGTGKSWLGQGITLTNTLIADTVTLGTYSLNNRNAVLDYKTKASAQIDTNLANATKNMTDVKAKEELTAYAQSIKEKINAINP